MIWIISYSWIVCLQQVAKTTKSSEMTTEEKKRILDAIGLTFLIRLLKSGTHSGSHKFLIMSTCIHFIAKFTCLISKDFQVWKTVVKIIMKCLYIFVILHNFVKPFIIFIDICFKVYFKSFFVFWKHELVQSVFPPPKKKKIEIWKKMWKMIQSTIKYRV